MTTVFINNLAVTLPQRFAAGDIMGEVAAAMLNYIQLSRVRSKVRYLLANGSINADGVEAKALELMDQELVPYMTSDDDDADDDPVMIEALAIARELIVARMAKEGLPPPKGLDLHAKALVDGMPALQERARLRIEARYRAAAEAMQEIA